MFATVIKKGEFDLRSCFPLFATIYIADFWLSRISTAIGARGVVFYWLFCIFYNVKHNNMFCYKTIYLDKCSSSYLDKLSFFFGRA